MQKRSALVLPFVNRLKTTSALDLGHPRLRTCVARAIASLHRRNPEQTRPSHAGGT
jgi:hypothetical protein